MPASREESRGIAKEAGGCRFCGTALRHSFVDLGMSPLCESYVSADRLDEMEPFYPLHAKVCERCFLVQLPQFVSAESIFGEYAYFSSYADSWVEHARRYVDAMIERFGLHAKSRVVEIGSNDGYLLQHFLRRAIPVLGIEPAANIARVAEGKGIPTRVAFFGVALAKQLLSEGLRADLVIGNNVLAQVPDLNGFVAGLAIVLADNGSLTMEFPHLQRLIEGNQFDTIYHEHFCYFSLSAVREIFAAHELAIVDVEELPTHGGSLRIYARHAGAEAAIAPAVHALCGREVAAGLTRLEAYRAFGAQVEATKRKLLAFLVQAKEQGKRIAGYGAPGKGNTLLNYCGIRGDFLDYTVDRNPYKQGKFLPGTHIPIRAPDAIFETRPDYVLVLPWNFQEEIVEQMRDIRSWGGRFVIPIPELTIR